MKVTIKAFKIKTMPSKFGNGTWNIVQAKFKETGEEVFDLKGFPKKITESPAAGTVLTGYISSRNYNDKNGNLRTSKDFNAITANYVYDLLMKMNPEIENIKTTSTTEQPKAQDSWQGDAPQPEAWQGDAQDAEISPEDIPFQP